MIILFSTNPILKGFPISNVWVDGSPIWRNGGWGGSDPERERLERERAEREGEERA